MNEENKFWLTCWAIIATVVCCLILTVGGCTAYERKVFAEGGYTETQLPGSCVKLWVKEGGPGGGK